MYEFEPKEKELYESEPKEREGEPIELVIPDAINTTASEDRQHSRGQESPILWPEWMPESKEAFAGVATLALLEALALILIIAL